MHYGQITSDERYLISTLRQWGFPPAQMATILGRHRSSITREIQRNATRADGGYRPFTASERAPRSSIAAPPSAIGRSTRWWARGRPDCVATLVERKTGFAMLGELHNRTSRGMTRRLRRLIRRAPDKFKTATADNGTEFHDYRAVERTTALRFYFATPYHAWERGSNENPNSLLRQYLPKRTSLAGLTQRRCDAPARRLNARPRKRLGYRTPEECFNAS